MWQVIFTDIFTLLLCNALCYVCMIFPATVTVCRVWLQHCAVSAALSLCHRKCSVMAHSCFHPHLTLVKQGTIDVLTLALGRVTRVTRADLYGDGSID